VGSLIFNLILVERFRSYEVDPAVEEKDNGGRSADFAASVAHRDGYTIEKEKRTFRNLPCYGGFIPWAMPSTSRLPGRNAAFGYAVIKPSSLQASAASALPEH
jgi:hypothetical protein